LRPGEWVPLAVGLVWAAALFVIVTAVPFYESDTETFTRTSPSPVVTHDSLTLVEENGSGILLIIGIPLLVTIMVGCALWLRGSRRGAGPIAWTFTGLLAGFNLLSILTIGVFIVPVTACLAIACAIRQARRHGDVRDAVVPT
jgi:hypothetical protein